MNNDKHIASDALETAADRLTEETLDDTSRRELLVRLGRVGAAAIPASLVLMDQAKAQANSGGGTGRGGNGGTPPFIGRGRP